ncbi:MAG: hypothetical protein EOO29_33985, partial [Comamonadaceae bacterium]
MVGGFFRKLFSYLPANTRVVLWMVALPLVLATIGYVEWRIYAAPATTAPNASQRIEIQRLETALSRIEKDRYATIVIDGQRYGNPLAGIGRCRGRRGID